MLTSTFCHIPGISEKTEQALWAAGVLSWDTPLPKSGVRLPGAIRDSWPGRFQESRDHHASRNPNYFAHSLPSRELWRLYQDFQDATAFLDIETTGLFGNDVITTIAMYDGKAIRYYVNGHNLHNFPADVMDYRLLVTYNGKCFDIPFIERFFNIQLPHAHIDLRYPLHSLGIKGGLKGCEHQLGMHRAGLEGVDGFDAVLLWHEYRKTRDPRVLDTLLAYNIQDAVVLQTLMVHTHNEKIKTTPFAGTLALSKPAPPEIPFQADFGIVKRLRPVSYGW